MNAVAFEIAKLSLSDGDTLVVLVPQVITAEQRARVAALAAAQLPAGTPVLVLDGGMTPATISKAAQ